MISETSTSCEQSHVYQPKMREQDRRRLGILYVKKEAKLSTRKIRGVEEGKDETVCGVSLFTVCQRRLGIECFWMREQGCMLLVAQRLEREPVESRDCRVGTFP